MMFTRRDFMATAGAGAAILPTTAWSGTSSDIAVLKRAYTELHPGLYRYATPAETGSRFDALNRAFDGAKTLPERYLVLSRFLATVRCGHTYANFFNQSDTVKAALFSGKTRLPFQFRWLGARMVVTRDFSGAGIAPGTEVLSIDGHTAADILKELLLVARADGSNDNKRRILMSVQGTEELESFDVFHPLIFGGSDRYRLELRTPGGLSRMQTVDAVGPDARRGQSSSGPAKKNDEPLWSFERHGETGLLAMPDWALYDSKWDWRGWLDRTFADIDRQGLTGLVIDVRANEGGLDCGNEVLARLIDQPLPLDTMLRLVRYRKVPDDLLPVLKTWDKSFRDWGKDAFPYDDRYYTLARDPGDTAITPKGPRFRGKVAVLVGPQNSSATFQFADAIQRNRLGSLVGEDTGGNQRGINGGAFFFLQLPQSGLEADLPLIGTFPRSPRPDSGLMPDLPAPQDIASIASGRDAAMEAALSLMPG